VPIQIKIGICKFWRSGWPVSLTSAISLSARESTAVRIRTFGKAIVAVH
jgi:hypothetical protein